MQAIVYPSGDGLAIIHPAPDALATFGISEIARKDVPAGVPYRIIDSSELPASRAFRAAWTLDMSAPDGLGIGPEAWAAEQAAAGV